MYNFTSEALGNILNFWTPPLDMSSKRAVFAAAQTGRSRTIGHLSTGENIYCIIYPHGRQGNRGCRASLLFIFFQNYTQLSGRPLSDSPPLTFVFILCTCAFFCVVDGGSGNVIFGF